MSIKGKSADLVIIDEAPLPCDDSATVEVCRDYMLITVFSPDDPEHKESYWVERRGHGHHAIPSPVPVFERARGPCEEGMTLEEMRSWLRESNGRRTGNS